MTIPDWWEAEQAMLTLFSIRADHGRWIIANTTTGVEVGSVVSATRIDSDSDVVSIIQRCSPFLPGKVKIIRHENDVIFATCDHPDCVSV